MSTSQSVRHVERVQPTVLSLYELAYNLRQIGYSQVADRLQLEAVDLRQTAREVDRRIGWE